MKKKIIAFTVIVLMALDLAGVSSAASVTEDNGVYNRIYSLSEKFPDGKYWNHLAETEEDVALSQNRDERFAESVTDRRCDNHSGYAVPGQYDCNYFDGGSQCYGFARKIFYDVFGIRISQCNAQGLKRTDYQNIRVGDYVRFGTERVGHSFIVLSKDGNNVTVLECNAEDRCMISWGKNTYDLEEPITSRGGTTYSFSYYVHAPNYDEINAEYSDAPSETPEVTARDISKIYDGSSAEPDITVSPPYLTVGYSLGDSSGAYGEFSAAFPDCVDSGVYTVWYEVSDPEEKYKTVTGYITVKVDMKSITVKADDITKEYGAPEPPLTYTAEGLVPGDSLSGIIITREEGEETGEYRITVSCRDGDPNYSIEFVFGTFTICKATPKAGDFDGNDVLNADDAVYLLRHIMRPERYPVTQSGDVNGDGKTDTFDAVYLLG